MSKQGSPSRVLLGGLAAVTLLAGCMTQDPARPDPEPDAAPAGTPDAGTTATACRTASGANVDLVEDRRIYDTDGQAVLEMSLTVSDLAGLADVDNDVPGAAVEAIFQEGSYGVGATAPNATLTVRGHTSRLAIQKSFKVKLTSHADLWHGARSINLNKQPYDLTRVRQQLSFELFRSIPNFTSMRTQFVHLLINGKDRGLYTQIENPDTHFLTNHGLDPLGTIYYPNNFSFDPISDATAADPNALALIIENKTNPDLTKLMQMIAAVNDRSQDINAVVQQYFNRNNYITWLAINLLLGDWDTRTQNFMLYSPSACEGWYFMPWDYDGSLGWDEQPGNPPRRRWQAGLANWWTLALHTRFILDPNNVADIRAMMTKLRTTAMSDPKIAALLSRYRPVVRVYESRKPDVWNLPFLAGTPGDVALIMAQWDAEYDRLFGVVANFDAEYDLVEARPMPVIMFQMLSSRDMFFQWTPSYDLMGGNLSYDFALSTSPTFEEGSMVYQQSGLGVTMVAPSPPPGTYYWRIITRQDQNPSENWQMSFNEAQQVIIP